MRLLPLDSDQQGISFVLLQLAMINIHSRLAAMSRDSCDSAKDEQGAAGGDPQQRALLFRRPRRCPGGGLYRQLDDVRPVLQVRLPPEPPAMHIL